MNVTKMKKKKKKLMQSSKLQKKNEEAYKQKFENLLTPRVSCGV